MVAWVALFLIALLLVDAFSGSNSNCNECPKIVRIVSDEERIDSDCKMYIKQSMGSKRKIVNKFNLFIVAPTLVLCGFYTAMSFSAAMETMDIDTLFSSDVIGTGFSTFVMVLCVLCIVLLVEQGCWEYDRRQEYLETRICKS